jgi:hypothetical protein
MKAHLFNKDGEYCGVLTTASLGYVVNLPIVEPVEIPASGRFEISPIQYRNFRLQTMIHDGVGIFKEE